MEISLGKAALAVAMTAFVTGCVQTQEAAMSDCEKYGFKKGTQAYAQCVMTRERERSLAFERSMKTLYCSDPYVSC